MNWKQEAIEKLRKYEAKKKAIDSLTERIRMLKSEATSIRSASGENVVVRGSGSSKEDLLLSNIVKQQELTKSLAETKRWVKWVEGGLSVLCDEEWDILERFFVNQKHGAADELAAELHLDVKTVYRRKDDALRKFTIALYGYVEN